MKAPSRIMPDTEGEKSTGRMEHISKDTSLWENRMVKGSSRGQMAELLKVCTAMDTERDMVCGDMQTEERTRASGARTKSTASAPLKIRIVRCLECGNTTF